MESLKEAKIDLSEGRTTYLTVNIALYQKLCKTTSITFPQVGGRFGSGK